LGAPETAVGSVLSLILPDALVKHDIISLMYLNICVVSTEVVSLMYLNICVVSTEPLIMKGVNGNRQKLPQPMKAGQNSHKLEKGNSVKADYKSGESLDSMSGLTTMFLNTFYLTPK